MRRFGVVTPLALALALTGSSCMKSSAPTTAPLVASDSASQSSSLESTPGTILPSTVEKVSAYAYGVALNAAGEAGNDSFKILVDSSDADIEVTLTGVPLHNKNTKLCPISTLDFGESLDACKTPKDNAPTLIPHGTTFKGVHVFQTKGSALLDVKVTFHPLDRKIVMRIPNVNPQPGASICKDNGCNAVFELKPRKPGAFRATATWDGIARATLDMETGSIAEKEYTTQGHPYHVVAKSTGSSDRRPGKLAIAGVLPSTVEAAIALRCDGARPVRSPTLRISWP